MHNLENLSLYNYTIENRMILCIFEKYRGVKLKNIYILLETPALYNLQRGFIYNCYTNTYNILTCMN